MPKAIIEVLQQIEERQRKLDALKKLLLDPDLADVVEGLGKNGASREAAKNGAKKHVARAKAPNTTGVRAAILKLNLPEQFELTHVIEALRAKSFKFGKRDAKAQVRDSLYVMARDGSGIRLVRKFDGTHPNLYEKTA